ncbi:MAG: DUF1801 domain-containing protein [Nocardioidaceae bacterium]|nr:DUF1801 domain-containing protein [Nocardioidaceae bacterium]
MAELKTTPDDQGALAFVAAVPDEVRRRDAGAVLELMAKVTGQPPVMWGSSIVGFGTYHYVYGSGREGDTMMIGFSPRKAATTVYLMDGFDDHGDLLARLGPHSTGKSCLYLERLDDIDPSVLEELVRRSYAATETR